MTKDKYISRLKSTFAHYGFTYCPLTEKEMAFLYDCLFTIEQAYEVGCDINSGFDFNESLNKSFC